MSLCKEKWLYPAIQKEVQQDTHTVPIYRLVFEKNTHPYTTISLSSEYPDRMINLSGFLYSLSDQERRTRSITCILTLTRIYHPLYPYIINSYPISITITEGYITQMV